MFVPFICRDFLNTFISEFDVDETILLNLFLTVIVILSLNKKYDLICFLVVREFFS